MIRVVSILVFFSLPSELNPQQPGQSSPVHLVGHSLGGLIVTLYAGLFPEKVASLVAVEGVGAYWTKMRDEQHPQQKVPNRPALQDGGTSNHR